MLCPFKMTNPNLKSWECEYDRCAWYNDSIGIDGMGECAIRELSR